MFRIPGHARLTTNSLHRSARSAYWRRATGRPAPDAVQCATVRWRSDDRKILYVARVVRPSGSRITLTVHARSPPRTAVGQERQQRGHTGEHTSELIGPG